MVEHQLRERLAGGVPAELAVESERLRDGQIGLDGGHRRAWAPFVRDDDPAALAEGVVDTPDGGFGALDLDCAA
jgi:hypothetical protein